MTGPAGDAWTADDNRKLLAMIEAKTPVAVIARKLKRTVEAPNPRAASSRGARPPCRTIGTTSAAAMPAPIDPYKRNWEYIGQPREVDWLRLFLTR
jgi:hypothetical protein